MASPRAACLRCPRWRGPGRVRGHELDHDRPPGSIVASTVLGVGPNDLADNLGGTPRSQGEVEKARPGYIHVGHAFDGGQPIREGLGDLPGGLSELPREHQRNVGREVSVCRVSRTLQPDVGVVDPELPDGGRQRLLQQVEGHDPSRLPST